MQHNTPDDMLNPLSLYRLARKAVRDKHSAAHAAVPSTDTGNPASSKRDSMTVAGRSEPNNAPITVEGMWLPASLSCRSGAEQIFPPTKDGASGLGPADMTARTKVGVPEPTSKAAAAEFALDLDDLQYYLTWGADYFTGQTSDIGTESAAPPFWMEPGEGGVPDP